MEKQKKCWHQRRITPNEDKKENQITNDVDNGTTADGTEKEEQSATETVEEPADSEETNDPFAEIPQVVLSKPVDYSLNQAIRQLEQMEASDEATHRSWKMQRNIRKNY